MKRSKILADKPGAFNITSIWSVIVIALSASCTKPHTLQDYPLLLSQDVSENLSSALSEKDIDELLSLPFEAEPARALGYSNTNEIYIHIATLAYINGHNQASMRALLAGGFPDQFYDRGRISSLIYFSTNKAVEYSVISRSFVENDKLAKSALGIFRPMDPKEISDVLLQLEQELRSQTGELYNWALGSRGLLSLRLRLVEIMNLTVNEQNKLMPLISLIAENPNLRAWMDRESEEIVEVAIAKHDIQRLIAKIRGGEKGGEKGSDA